jgi:hypothetical protein
MRHALQCTVLLLLHIWAWRGCGAATDCKQQLQAVLNRRSPPWPSPSFQADARAPQCCAGCAARLRAVVASRLAGSDPAQGAAAWCARGVHAHARAPVPAAAEQLLSMAQVCAVGRVSGSINHPRGVVLGAARLAFPCLRIILCFGLHCFACACCCCGSSIALPLATYACPCAVRVHGSWVAWSTPCFWCVARSPACVTGACNAGGAPVYLWRACGCVFKHVFVFVTCRVVCVSLHCPGRLCMPLPTLALCTCRTGGCALRHAGRCVCARTCARHLRAGGSRGPDCTRCVCCTTAHARAPLQTRAVQPRAIRSAIWLSRPSR